MATETIRDYLVSLGFKVDESSFKKFTGGIESATKGVIGLVAAIQGAALTVGAAVAAFASNMEALYFAAQRTQSSATNLKAFEKAMVNLGASSNDALSSVEGLARFMRNNPGGEGFIQSLGVRTRDVNGNLRDTVEITADLGEELAKMPTYLSNQYATMLGISERTMLAMRSGEFRRQLDEQKRLLKDANYQKATKDAHDFMIKLRELGTEFEIFGLRVYEALVKKLGVSLESISEWMQKNGPMVADRVADIITRLLELSEKIGPAIMWLVDKLIELDKQTDGWSTKIIALIALLNVLGGSALIGGILGLAAAFVKLGTGITTASTAGGAAAGGGLLARLLSLAGRMGVGAALLFHSGELNSGEAEELAKRRALGDADFAKRGISGAVDFFVSKGWTKEQAAGIVANLKHESNLDPNARGDSGKAVGIAQWHPDRQAAFKAQYGKDLSQATLQEQLDFVNFELTKGSEQKAGALLRATSNAQQAGQIVSRNYERPLAADVEAAKRGATAVQISQTTNINVHGSDATSTGKAVAQEQGRVNDTLTRNMQSAVS